MMVTTSFMLVNVNFEIAVTCYSMIFMAILYLNKDQIRLCWLKSVWVEMKMSYVVTVIRNVDVIVKCSRQTISHVAFACISCKYYSSDRLINKVRLTVRFPAVVRSPQSVTRRWPARISCRYPATKKKKLITFPSVCFNNHQCEEMRLQKENTDLPITYRATHSESNCGGETI